MLDRDAEPAALVRSLTETIERVEAVVRRLPADSLTVSTLPGGWSPNEILWHIRATADVYGEHISRILNEDAPRWRHVSPRARMKKARYDQLPFADSFTAFSRQRDELFRLLGGIPAEAWQRIALVRTDERDARLSLHDRVWRMANHEEIHCAQMEEVAAALNLPQ